MFADDRWVGFRPLILEGATEEVLQFRMPLKSIYNKNFILMNESVFFNIVEKLIQ